MFRLRWKWCKLARLIACRDIGSIPKLHAYILSQILAPLEVLRYNGRPPVSTASSPTIAYQVFVHGAHGTKCYILLRGLARVLIPHEDASTGAIHFAPHIDLGPGDVRQSQSGIPGECKTVERIAIPRNPTPRNPMASLRSSLPWKRRERGGNEGFTPRGQEGVC